MPSWREVEQQAPDLAALTRAAFSVAKHATMATLRADGSPRISGTEVQFDDDGELRLGSMPGARKARDLQRDPRVAVHSPTTDPGERGEAWAGEAKVAGRAIQEPSGGANQEPSGRANQEPAGRANQEQSGRANDEPPGDEGAHRFRLDLTEVVWTGLTDDRQALRILSWHPGRGQEEHVRT